MSRLARARARDDDVSLAGERGYIPFRGRSLRIASSSESAILRQGRMFYDATRALRVRT